MENERLKRELKFAKNHFRDLSALAAAELEEARGHSRALEEKLVQTHTRTLHIPSFITVQVASYRALLLPFSASQGRMLGDPIDGRLEGLRSMSGMIFMADISHVWKGVVVLAPTACTQRDRGEKNVIVILTYWI